MEKTYLNVKSLKGCKRAILITKSMMSVLGAILFIMSFSILQIKNVSCDNLISGSAECGIIIQILLSIVLFLFGCLCLALSIMETEIIKTYDWKFKK